MSNLDAAEREAAAAASATTTKTLAIVAPRSDFEEDDHIESYVKHMRAKGIEVGQLGNDHTAASADMDSDEEVYATARAIDAAQAAKSGRGGGFDDGDGNGFDDRGGTGSKKDMELLVPVDHAAMDYPDFNRCFYEEHADIAALSDDQVAKIRQDLSMTVFGHDPVRPCISFAHFGFGERLLSAIIKQGYTEPTGVQRQAVPAALSGRDIIGIAQTGSGKTAAFLWPMLVHIMDQPELERGDGPIGLVLAPTRELAHQIYTEAKKFAKAYQGLRVGVLYGGVSKNDQFKELRAGVELLVSTPGRLIDMIKMKATNLSRVTYLVLDEADQMLNLGFEPQVRSVCSNVRPDRQTLLFSATFRRHIERLAREFLTNPMRICIGDAGQSNSDIVQIPVVLESDAFKWGWLTHQLPSLAAQGSVIVFVSRKAGVEELAGNLESNVGPSIAAAVSAVGGVSHTFPGHVMVGALHGDMLQSQRDQVLRDFKAGKTRVLVSTDVAARGLDIKGIKTVVNYDLAKDIDGHVHRIGRTGRAGEKGTAFTLLTQAEDRFAADLVQHLENAGQTPSEALMALAMQNGRFRKMRQQTRGSRGGHGGFSGGRGRGRGGFGRGGFDHGDGGRGRGRGFPARGRGDAGQNTRRRHGIGYRE
ncbi:P-loop containing nucleoside triphosphate hydrolase protein [Entophlyctis helioformis]|nr:P-loop containing nucleoside triphosphate hydrolase protein [Entophlyctis helioformis]